MKKLLVAIMTSIIAVGAISAASLLLGFDDNFSITSVNPLKSGATMMGHVILTATDENGQIIGYRQTDNVVTNFGDECIADIIFDVASAATCTATGTVDAYDNIAIGTGDCSSCTETTRQLVQYVTDDFVSPTGFDSAVITTSTTFGGASTLITAIFLDVDATITEAAIQAGTVTDGTASTLAIQSFTGLTIGANNDLTIQWTIVIDGN